MRVLVAYASMLGATRGIAERIADTLNAHGIEADLAPADEVDEPVRYDAFVIGSAVHGGHWLKPAAEFVRLHAALLRERPVWLFSSGPIGDKYVNLEQPAPKEVRDVRRLLEPREHRVFGGAFDRQTASLDELPLVQRTVARAFLPEGDFRDWPAIEAWAYSIARQLGAGRRPDPAPHKLQVRELQEIVR
jgi:menaquinone-dependent protoporphyrinogen oxidase